jgi:hypothetical protein
MVREESGCGIVTHRVQRKPLRPSSHAGSALLTLATLGACAAPAPRAPAPSPEREAGVPAAPAVTVSSAVVNGIPQADRVRLSEAFRLGDLVGERLWPGWNATPFAVLLITPSREYLLRHPAPTPDFVRIGTDALLKAEVYARPRSYPTTLLATFPAIAGVPTVVIGQASETGRRTTNWVLTVLHEHFHQMQMSHPEYQARIAALDLARGDESGQWMLSFPFPYDSSRLAARYDAFAHALTSSIAAAPSREGAQSVQRVIAARAALEASMPADAYRYLTFQMWQEGIARYTELQCARLAVTAFTPSAALRSLPDFTSFTVEADALEREIITGAVSSLPRDRRIAFYPVGAAVGLWLDQVQPGWRARYFGTPLSLDPLMP